MLNARTRTAMSRRAVRDTMLAGAAVLSLADLPQPLP